jgi:hypothetical protein
MPEAALAPAGMGETRPPFKWAGGKTREPAPRGLLSLDSADTEAVAQEGRPCSC